MDQSKKSEILSYLQNQIAQQSYRAQNYVVDTNGELYPQRNVFTLLEKQVEEFQQGNSAFRWLVVHGLRGVGKTTLALQLFNQINVDSLRKIYVSVDEVTRQLGVSLYDLLLVYEEILGTVFERLEAPVYIFLDEVQYDDNWATTLKTIYDRSPKVFVFATGSSSVMLQTNPDITRRAIFEKVHPMSFTEYMKLKERRAEKSGLSKKLGQILFKSENATQVFEGLAAVKTSVQQYWANTGRLEIDRYTKIGTLPFMLRLENDGVAYDQMKKTVDSIITKDMPQLEAFDTSVLACVPRLLYLIANSDAMPISTLSNDLNLSMNTTSGLLDVLEKTELLTRIYPFGARSKQVRKPSKFLFASPTFRSMYLNFIGSTLSEEQMKGKLYEDLVGMYLSRYFSRKSIAHSLTYDSAKGGADFIVGLKESDEYIAVEVGAGEKNFRQLIETSKKIGERCRYGMNISMSHLSIDESALLVSVPLSYFLLI